MSHGLEHLYVSLGRPAYFWPCVMLVLLALCFIGGMEQ